MTPRRLAKVTLEKLLGVHILRVLPPGCEFLQDLRIFLPNFSGRMIFDVGANVGQSAQAYLKHFPNAKIFCFEPVRGTFETLSREMRSHCNVECFHLGLSSRQGRGLMMVEGASSGFQLVESAGRERTEEVRLGTIDGICEQRAIDHIDLLKIDTEGHDLEVLKGSEKMLNASRIDVVQVEASMNPSNTRHIDLQKFRDYLEPKGYRIFKLYDQKHEFHLHRPQLRRTNPVFISERTIKSNHVAGKPRRGT